VITNRLPAAAKRLTTAAIAACAREPVN